MFGSEVKSILAVTRAYIEHHWSCNGMNSHATRMKHNEGQLDFHHRNFSYRLDTDGCIRAGNTAGQGSPAPHVIRPAVHGQLMTNSPAKLHRGSPEAPVGFGTSSQTVSRARGLVLQKWVPATPKSASSRAFSGCQRSATLRRTILTGPRCVVLLIPNPTICCKAADGDA